MKTNTFFITILSFLLFLNHSLLAQTQKGTIIASNGIYDGLERTVAISDSGNRFIAGAMFANLGSTEFGGAALIYEFSGGDWQQLGDDLLGEDDFGGFGRAVEMAPSGNRIAVASNMDVKVFDWSNNQWEQVGDDISIADMAGVGNLQFSDNGEILGVGFLGNDVEEHIRIYKLINNVWTELGVPVQGEAFYGDFAMSGDGERIVVQYDLGNLLRELRTYDFINGTWTEVATVLSSAAGEVLTAGFDLSASGNRLITTTRIDDTPDGYVTTYDYQGNDWVETLPELPVVIDNNFGMTLRASNSGNIFVLGTADDNPIAGISDIFVYQVFVGQWQLAGDVINGSADDEAANGHVDISGDGRNILYAGNELPDGTVDEFIVAYDVSEVLSVNDSSTGSIFNVSPNPTSGEITLDLGTVYSEVELNIYNVLGELIQQGFFSNTQTLDCTLKGTSGIYLLQVITSEGTSKTIKIIKE